ncbi:sigma-70 family RNA polymerase sigma factor [bacterium]|nr:sigma-70 family RNA polymerase sigma factor [bacterium]MCI0602179.1 sigma-70 family RNA polymerase sigma factor [bacterium]
MAKSRDEKEAEFLSIQRDYGNLIRNAIHRVYPSFSDFDLQDIEQEVHIKIWKLLDNSQKIVYPSTYLYKMAATTAIDVLRKMRFKQQETITEATAGVNPNTESRLFDVLENVLNKLAESRQIAVRFYLQGYSADEIGKLMQWSSARARNLVYRGLEDLRVLLKEEGIYYESE